MLAAQGLHRSPAPGNPLPVELAGLVGSANISPVKPASPGRRVSVDNHGLRGPVGLRDELDPPGARKTDLRARRGLEAHRFAGRCDEPVATARSQSTGIQAQLRLVVMHPAATSFHVMVRTRTPCVVDAVSEKSVAPVFSIRSWKSFLRAGSNHHDITRSGLALTIPDVCIAQAGCPIRRSVARAVSGRDGKQQRRQPWFSAALGRIRCPARLPG